MTSYITAIFKTRVTAEDALHRLEAIGITDKQISLVSTDETRGRSFNLETHTNMDKGVAGGATAGGLFGAVMGAMAIAGTLAIPGLNMVVTGALVGSLAGLATGAVAGGIVGGLIGAGIPEYEAKIYEKEIRSGSILLAVETHDAKQKDDVKKIFQTSEGHNLAA